MNDCVVLPQSGLALLSVFVLLQVSPKGFSLLFIVHGRVLSFAQLYGQLSRFFALAER